MEKGVAMDEEKGVSCERRHVLENGEAVHEDEAQGEDVEDERVWS